MKRINIFPMGDSITEGDGNGSAYKYALFEQLYLAGVKFSFVGPSRNGDIRLPEAYAGHGGHCGYVIGTDDKEPTSLRFKLTQPSYAHALKSAHMILLWIGFNDNGKGYDPTTIGKRYDSLLDEIYAIQPHLIVYCATLFHSSPELNQWLLSRDWETYNRERHREIHIVDMTRPPYRLDQQTGDFPEDDGHPNEAGNRKIASAWFEAIVDKIRELNAEQDENYREPKRVTGIEGDFSPLVLRPLEGKILHAQVKPVDAQVNTILWTSNNPAVASVDDYGKVRAHQKGKATITATSLDGGFTLFCPLSVAGEPVDLSSGMKLVVHDTFTKPLLWDGPTEVIKPAYQKLSMKGVIAGKLCWKKALSLGQQVYLEVSCSQANHRKHQADHYITFSIGNVTLRLSGGLESMAILQNGNLLQESCVLQPVAVYETYGLMIQPTTATLYLHNEMQFCVPLKTPLQGNTLHIHWSGLGRADFTQNLIVKTR